MPCLNTSTSWPTPGPQMPPSCFLAPPAALPSHRRDQVRILPWHRIPPPFRLPTDLRRRPFRTGRPSTGLCSRKDQPRRGHPSSTITAPATYELPPDAVGEAIVNAIAHRDYNSHASVEVRLFSDRLEVWNPGTLPGTLTLEDLRHDHPSVPNNPLIAESLYLTAISRSRLRTQRMIDLCHDAGLPAPDSSSVRTPSSSPSGATG